MLLGPVFNAELVTTARRGRYYVIRFLYGLMILFQIYLIFESHSRGFGRASNEMDLREMADFGASLFAWFAGLQAVVVILLTPALVGGTIAEERQRKTLHYLLTSDLTSVEIVLSKLAARLLHVIVLVAVGLPVVCLIGLFGGIDFDLLLLIYAGTLTTIYFLAALSILVSVVSRRPREAVSLLYILEFAWLIAPTALLSWMPTWAAPWPTIAGWINPALKWVAVSSPIYLATPTRWSVAGGLTRTALEFIATQVVYGTLFVLIAASRLRPSSRNEGAERTGTGWLATISRKRRWFARPECGDDAMLWKERYVARTSGATKTVLVGLVVVSVGLIGYSGFDLFVAAMDELWRNGYNSTGRARSDFNGFLRALCTGTYLLWMLGVASAAASGLTSEREEDTWINLISTPLDGVEILRAKMMGPIWALRPIAYLMFAFWGLGLLAGSIHPLGVLAGLVELIVFSWFLTALGTYFSLRAKNSTRSLASTMALLIFVNGGYLFCCIPMQTNLNTAAILAGCTPALFAASLVSPENVWEVQGKWATDMVLASVLGLLFYAVAAGTLMSTLFGQFDEAVDRPDRFRRDLSQEKQRLGGPKPAGSGDDLA